MRLSSAILNFQENNCINTVRCLIKALNAKVTATTIARQLREHPEYPSLLSMSDTLNGWKIDNLSVRIPAEKLVELPLPFVAKVKDNRREAYLAVREYNDRHVVVSDAISPKWKKISNNEFINNWSGVVMLTETFEHSGEKEYEKNKRIESINKMLARIAIVLLPLIWAVAGGMFIYESGTAAWPALSLLTLKLLGCWVGILLLWYEIDEHNPALQKVCNMSRNINCRAVLNSKAAKIGSFFTWSDAGFIYFTGGFLALLLNGMHTSAAGLVSYLTLLALPYSVFSIYYQWRVAKQWCILCLTVQALFITEFMIALLGGMYHTALIDIISAKVMLVTMLSFIIPAIAWLLLKPYILSAKENNTHKTDLARLKFNQQIFTSILLHQKPVEHVTTGLGIVLGNPTAKYKIIKVCNPYCKPCAAAHTAIDELLQGNNDVSVQIIFTASGGSNDKRTMPVRHLMAIEEKGDQHVLQTALHDWYSAPVKNYEAFAGKYTMNGELQHQENRINAMNEWCNRTGIMFTPTFFINGFQLPAMYKVSDLKYLLQQ